MYRDIRVKRKGTDLKRFYPQDIWIDVLANVERDEYNQLPCNRVNKYNVGAGCEGCLYLRERFSIPGELQEGMSEAKKVSESCLVSEAEARLKKRESKSIRAVEDSKLGIYAEEDEKHGFGFVFLQI
ncbi:MAG TPA: hypothetical protein VI933_03005 [archaeon]|nr:hypothetical protein [archaeon]